MPSPNHNGLGWAEFPHTIVFELDNRATWEHASASATKWCGEMLADNAAVVEGRVIGRTPRQKRFRLTFGFKNPADAVLFKLCINDDFAPYLWTAEDDHDV